MKTLIILIWLIGIFTEKSEAAVTSHVVKDITDRFLDFRFRENPDFAAQFGIKKYRNTAEQWNFDAFRSRVEESRDMLTNVTNLLVGPDGKGASFEQPDDELTLQILQENLETFIAGEPFLNYTVIFNEEITDLPNKLIKFKVENIADLNDWYNRCLSYTTMLNDQYQILTGAEYQNLHPLPKITVRRLVRLLNVMTVETPEDFAMFKPWKDLGVNNTNRTFYEQGLAMSGGMLNKIKEITTYLNETYLPTRARDSIGLSALPGGAEMYKTNLKWHTTPEYTPEKAHQLGLSEVNRIYGLMDQIAKKHNYSVRNYVEWLIQQPNQTYPDSDAMVQGYRDMINIQIDPKLAPQFNYKPNISLVVEADPNSKSMGFYESPSVDGKEPGRFKFDNSHPEQSLKVNMLSIAVHEANPGHHYQISYVIETGLPLFRRLIEYGHIDQIPFNWPFYTAYTEGWGLYAESLAPELNISTTDDENLGRLGLEGLRAARLVVDSGMHYYNWTYERAVDYLFNYTTLSRVDCEGQIQRYIRWPGQACAYKVGEMEIRKLRTKAETELDSRFDIKAFHNTLLSTGPLSIPKLQTIMTSWIDNQNPATQKPATQKPATQKTGPATQKRATTPSSANQISTDLYLSLTTMTLMALFAAKHN